MAIFNRTRILDQIEERWRGRNFRLASSLHGYRILGAGTPFKVSGSAVSNLDFLNIWQVYGKRPVERGVEAGPPPRLRGDAILVGEIESASGLIYWNGKLFVWYQQGD